MKPTYSNFEAKENSQSFLELPPAGVYVGTIMAVRVVEADGEKNFRDAIELMVEITEGEYKGRFTDVYNENVQRFGKDKAWYKGIFKLIPPMDGDEDWRYRAFEGNIWCVEESNPGFHFRKPDGSWDEQGLAGKTIGINIRNRIYNYTASDETVKERKTIEIARFETVQNVHNGKVHAAKDRDTRKVKEDESTSVPDGFTQVNTELPPWG